MSIDRWIKKMWYIYTMKYYSAIKRNKIELLNVDVDEPRVSYKVNFEREKKIPILTHIYGI